MKRSELFKRLPKALAERDLGEGMYFVTITEASGPAQDAQFVMSAMVSMGGLNQRQLADPLCFSFDFDADSDIKRLTAVVTDKPAPYEPHVSA